MQIADLLQKIIKETVKAKSAALLLSGGVDSLSLGFACDALGIKVHAYTFQIGETRTEDSVSAERACLLMGWEYSLVKVPIVNLEKDFLILANEWGCKKKTQFECTFPFLHLIPQIKEKYVLSGIAADGHYGLSKKAMIHYRYPKEKFDLFRNNYFSQENPAGQVQQLSLLEYHGHIQCAPYLDKRVFDYFIQFDWDELNKPYQKYKVLTAYREKFQKVGRRPHMNLQLVAGVDHVFEKLLTSKLNLKNRTRVMDLCRDYSSPRKHAR
tara:strand:+ start:2671 stop:3474 length:804 start_codon:yes stop_codon:yes gene_type:complete